MKRIDAFLNADELDDHAVKKEKKETTFDNLGNKNKVNAVEVVNAHFAWEKETDPFLRDMNLQVKEGELVAVVGAVGAGKSSFISSLLGEMETVSGSVITRGKVAYVPQQAWIQNATVQVRAR